MTEVDSAQQLITVARFEGMTKTTPTIEELLPADLESLLTKHEVRLDKKGPQISFTIYQPGTTRANKNVIALTALTLDFDDGPPPDVLTPSWSAWYYIVYSTHSNTAERPKWRVVFPFKRAVQAADWKRVHEHLATHLAQDLIDRTSASVSTAYLLPACPPDQQESAFTQVNQGRWLNVEEFNIPKKQPKATPQLAPYLPPENESDYAAWVRAAIDSEISELSAAGEGGRNSRLYSAARNLAEIVAAGVASEAEVIGPLEAAAHAIGLGERETASTIKSGYRKGLENPRKLPERKKVSTALRGDSARACITELAPSLGAESPQPETDAPILNGLSTEPYAVNNGGIVFITTRDRLGDSVEVETVVCDFVAAITEEIIAEDGGLHFKIVGKGLAGNPFSLVVSAEQFADERVLRSKLTSVAGAHSPVRAKMSAHLAPAIQKLTGHVTHSRRMARTGWLELDTGPRFLIPGREPDNVSLCLPRKLPYSYDPAADYGQGLEALRSLILAQPKEMAAVALTFAFQGPLALLVGWRNERSALFIAGRTGSLKSSWVQVLMSIWGADFMKDDLLIKWGDGATRNAIMSFAAHAHDLPFLVDNYKPNTGGGTKDFVNLIHNIVEGGERERLTRAAELKTSKSVYAWPIFTGEDVPDSDAASAARCLVVHFSWPPGNSNDALTRAQEKAPHLCAIGGMWLSWLESGQSATTIKRIREKFQARRAIWMGVLRRTRPDMANIGRVASNLATNELTWEAMTDCPQLRELCLEFDQTHKLGLEEVATGMAHHTAESLEASRFLSALRELLATSSCVLVNRTMSIPDKAEDRVVGWHDDAGGAYLLPGTARKAVDRHLIGGSGLGNLSDQTLYKQLDGLGVIASKGAGGKSTKMLRVGDATQRVLHLSAEALGSGPDTGEEND